MATVPVARRGPVRSPSHDGERNGPSSSAAALPTFWRVADLTSPLQHFTQPLVLDRQGLAQARSRESRGEGRSLRDGEVTPGRGRATLKNRVKRR
jgi:hypothetical protein